MTVHRFVIFLLYNIDVSKMTSVILTHRRRFGIRGISKRNAERSGRGIDHENNHEKIL